VEVKLMWWRNSRLDRIEVNIERIEVNINRLAEISEATNRRIDRFVEATAQQIEVTAQQVEGLNARTEQLQRAVEYLLSRDR
jgi:archaellum component FlaC